MDRDTTIEKVAAELLRHHNAMNDIWGDPEQFTQADFEPSADEDHIPCIKITLRGDAGTILEMCYYD